MKKLVIIRRKSRQCSSWEVAQLDVDSNEPVIVFDSVATFSDYQNALNYMLSRRLIEQQTSIDTRPKETR